LAHVREFFDDYALSAITPPLVATYRDARLIAPDQRFSKNLINAPRVSKGTVKNELDMLSKVLDVTTKEFGIALPNGNSVAGIRKPSGAGARERRLVADEQSRLLCECQASRNQWLAPAVSLAIETAMRQGEMLNLHWEDIDLENRIAQLKETKNGEERAVPLSTGAIKVLRAIPVHLSGRVFPIDRMTLYKAFERACARAGIVDLTFHDLRHEALSILAERGDLSVLELAAVSGHKTLQVLKRYTHIQARKLAMKLG
jgi:integrase